MRLLFLGLILLMLIPRTAVSWTDDAGGPALVAIETRSPLTLTTLIASNITVVRDMGGYVLATANRGSMGVLTDLGLRWEVLDEDTRDQTYYAAYFRDDVRVRLAAARTGILRLDGLVGIVRATPEEALSLAMDGIEIARVFLRPARLSSSAKTENIVPRRTPAQANPVIETIVDSVSIDRINAHVQRLQDFVTRYSEHDSCYAASQWIKTQFESYGIDSVYFHNYSVRYADNVVAVLPGRVHPEEIVIIGGHYDSITSDPDNCPGADDNASGTACVLECARVLSNYEFNRTLVFIAFSGEEQGLLGSDAFAGEAAARGDEIIGMVAVDMIGYVASNDQLDLDVLDNPSSQWMFARLMDVGALYVPGLPIVDGVLMGGTSDHASFWQNGYDALLFYEDGDKWSPYIHTANDIVGLSYISTLLAKRSVRLAAAFMADLATPFDLGINHEPLTHTADTTNPYRIVAGIYAAGPLNTDSLLVRYSTGSGWNTVQMISTGVADEYDAFIPAQPGGTVVDYHIVAEDGMGNRVTDPADAPAEVHSFAVGTLAVVFEDDFEVDRGWTVGDIDDDAPTGIWVRDEPFGTYLSNIEIQSETDHTPDPGELCFVTGNAPHTSQFNDDVDDGKTTLFSPVFDLSPYPNAFVSYYRWYTNDTGDNPNADAWVVDVSSDSGSTWTRLETDTLSERSWLLVEHNLLHAIPMARGVQFRFIASDDEFGSVVEAGVDDFLLVTYQGSGTGINSGRPDRLAAIALEQNIPNPFNPETMIRFTIPDPGASATLKVYDVKGRVVATLLNNTKVLGTRDVRWDGKNSRGNNVPSGVYFYRLDAGGTLLSRKLVLLR